MCCCTQHVNADYLQTKLNDLLRINEQAVIKDNETLVSNTLCNSDSIACIERDCKQCGVDNSDALKENIHYCSHDCRKNKDDCSNHTISFLQFKSTSYTTNKGQTKKKVALVSERITISQFFASLKVAMQGFARHRFNHFHTKMYKMAVEGLQEGQIIKVQDFSENYTCFVPDEVQSLHWTQTQATLFPVVTFRKTDTGKLLEDHLVFISDDLEHDCAFVEMINADIHSYYQQAGVEIVRDIEFNDGCAAQFKSIKSFGLFSKRSIHTDRVYFESSHGKGPSDGVGGVIKSLVATAVCSQRVIIRDAKEFFDFLSDRCCIENEIGASDIKHQIKTRKFFFLDKQDVKRYRDSLDELPYKTLKGTRKIHQMTIHSSLKSHELAIRNYACLCENCAQINLDSSVCDNLQMLQEYGQRKVVNLLNKAADEDSDDEMCDELQDDKEQWQMSDTVHMIKKDDIVVIRSVDTFNPYYLVKAMDEACELEEMFADDYGHTLPPNHTVVKGHYLEVQKRTKDGCFMFEDTTKVVAISAFCVSGVSPPLTTSKGIKKRKPITLYEISPEINDILLGLVTGYNI